MHSPKAPRSLALHYLNRVNRLEERRLSDLSISMALVNNLKKEEVMPQTSGSSKRSEKGLLTPDNCVVAIIDLQPQMLFGVANFDRQAIIRDCGGFAIQ
jgi:hypothetical protein